MSSSLTGYSVASRAQGTGTEQHMDLLMSKVPDTAMVFMLGDDGTLSA